MVDRTSSLSMRQHFCFRLGLPTLLALSVFVAACGDGGRGAPPPNRAPVAVAGNDQTVQVGDTATLSGSASSDPDGDTLSFQWTLLSRPAGSAAALGSPTSVQATLVPDVKGSYQVRLTVTDSGGLAATDDVIVTAPNRAPVSTPSASASIAAIETPVDLLGSGFDPDGDSLTYEWTLISQPNSSTASIASPTSMNTSLTPDVNGEYRIELTVTDPDGESGTTLVTFKGATPLQGIISTDRTLTASESPYILTGTVQIAFGTTLTADPAIEVYGQNNRIEVFGALSALGTASNGIYLHQVNVSPRGTNTEHFFVDLDFVDFDGGSFYKATGLAIYGSFSLKRSFLINLPELYVWYPTANVLIEQNVLCLKGGIYVLADTVTVSILNNNFSYCGPGIFSDQDVYGVTNPAAYNGAEVLVHMNTFVDTAQFAVAIPAGFSSDPKNLNATSNYWSTTDQPTIEAMILDRNDDLNRTHFIPFSPFLTSPDPSTP